ncbi:MAG: hypothetical protein AB7G39_00520 [Alphaproteobacteria bacterium]
MSTLAHRRAWVAALLGAGLLGGCDDPPPSAPVEKPKPAVSGPAQAALEIGQIRYEWSPQDERHRYVHDRSFKESAGVGYTVERGRVCVELGKLCVDAVVRYRVEPGTTLTQPNHHVATKLPEDRITIEYWGTDDNGNPVTLQRVMTVRGTEFAVE